MKILVFYFLGTIAMPCVRAIRILLLPEHSLCFYGMLSSFVTDGLAWRHRFIGLSGCSSAISCVTRLTKMASLNENMQIMDVVSHHLAYQIKRAYHLMSAVMIRRSNDFCAIEFTAIWIHLSNNHSPRPFVCKNSLG